MAAAHTVSQVVVELRRIAGCDLVVGDCRWLPAVHTDRMAPQHLARPGLVLAAVAASARRASPAGHAPLIGRLAAPTPRRG
jgi:hypothetical protein